MISEINFKNLKKVKRNESTEDLFKFFYEVLYNENKSNFEFNKFKKVAFDT